MRFNLTAVVFATISVSQATVLFPRSPYYQLLNARQTAPAGPCDNACSTFSAALNRCTDVACLCTASIETGLQSCVNCALTGNPSQDTIQTAQSLVNSFQSICSGSGLSSVTFPGGIPVSTPSTPSTPPPVVAPTTTVGPVTTLTSVNTVSQTVIGPPSTTATGTATGTSASTPGKNGGFGLHQVTHGFGLNVALLLGTLMAI